MTAADEWVMTLLCSHELSIHLQFGASAPFKFKFFKVHKNIPLIKATGGL